MLNKALLWMDGSLFFRLAARLMEVVQRICEGSFLVGLFVADYNEEHFRQSRFVRATEFLLNRFPKIASFGRLPVGLARVLNGSFIIRSLCAALDTPLETGTVTAALPLWGLLAVAAGAPFLPTMALAGLLGVIALITLCTRRFTLSPTALCVLVYIVITCFCGITSFTPRISIPIALLSAVFMFSFWLMTACLVKRTQVDLFFAALAVSAAAAGTVGVYQFIIDKVDMTWVDVELFGDIQFRMYATFGNPNVYGTYLLLAIPLCAALVFYVRKPLYKLLLAGVTGLLLFNLVQTFSRGCYLALAVAAFVFVVLFEKRMILVFLAGLAAAPFVLPDRVLNRLLSITNLADSSTEYRLSIWQSSLRIIKDFWMTGVGQGYEAYNTVYPYYAFNDVVSPHSHNQFFQVLIETGIVGLLAFLAVLAWFYREQFCFLRRTDSLRDRVVSIALIAAVTGFLFQGIFDFAFYNYRVMLAFFLYIGLGAAFIRLTDDRSGTGSLKPIR